MDAGIAGLGPLLGWPALTWAIGSDYTGYALEGSEHGIRANSISPGLIESSATRQQLGDPAWAREMLGKTLLGRLGRPEEVANVALFLASAESSYVTGIDIVVDGGMKVW